MIVFGNQPEVPVYDEFGEEYPKAGEVWRHTLKNTLYTIVGVANTSQTPRPDKAPWPIMIVYTGPDMKFWTRPWSEFRERYHKSAEQPRFRDEEPEPFI